MPLPEPRQLAAICVPGVAALMLCVIELTTRSLWLDEGATAAITAQHGTALWQAISADGGNMLAYYVGMHIWVGIAGHSALALRLPSVAADCFSAVCVALLGMRLFGDRRAALAAGLLTAVSIPLVFWGQDARGYAALVAAISASFLALMVILESDPERPPPPLAVAAYVLVTTLALYIGGVALLVIPAQVIAARLVGRRLRTVVGALTVVAALCVPLLVLAVHQGGPSLSSVPPFSSTTLAQGAIAMVSGGLAPQFHISNLTVIATAAGVALVLTGVTLSSIALLRRSESPWVLMPGLWVVVPAVLALAAAVIGVPMELPRAATMLIPGVALVLAWLLFRSGWDPPFGWGWLVLILALRLIVLVPNYGTSPEPWHAVVKRVLSVSRPSDCVAFYPQDGRMTFDYYRRGMKDGHTNAPRSVLPDAPWGHISTYLDAYTLPIRVTMSDWAVRCQRLWLISAKPGSPGTDSASRARNSGLGWLEQGLKHRFVPVSSQRYGWSSTILVREYRQLGKPDRRSGS
ncbi:MAG: glycosyltransferase family 39 protein [Solirubrobacterales bacterium]|nr:glycosyltransferase family 39 protein [Solirubrobacterales bacterium]